MYSYDEMEEMSDINRRLDVRHVLHLCQSEVINRHSIISKENWHEEPKEYVCTTGCEYYLQSKTV